MRLIRNANIPTKIILAIFDFLKVTEHKVKKTICKNIQKNNEIVFKIRILNYVLED